MRLFPLIAFLVALVLPGSVEGRAPHGNSLMDIPTGQSGNPFSQFAGYKWLCGTSGCFSAGMTIVVPTLAYDTGGTGCPANFCGYIFPGIDDSSGGGNLAQAGITMEMTGGVASYRAWWECFPLNNVQHAFDAGATMNVNAGDTVAISVTCTNCTVGVSPPGTTSWTFTVNDMTTSQSVSKTGFACPMNNDIFYIAFWAVEMNDTSNVNFGNLTISNATVNGVNPGFAQKIRYACTSPGVGGIPCAMYEFTHGGGNTGTTINPSTPSASADGFKLCVNSNGASNTNGTTNYALCAAP